MTEFIHNLYTYARAMDEGEPRISRMTRISHERLPARGRGSMARERSKTNPPGLKATQDVKPSR